MKGLVVVACCAALACSEIYRLDDPTQLQLGALCGSDQPACPAAVPVCGRAGSAGAPYFCTAECGATPGGSMPPPEGALTCERLVTIGTPYCGLSDGGSATTTWYCGLLCGSAGSDDYGPCPPGLTCTSNVCE